MPGTAPGAFNSGSSYMSDTHANRPAAASTNNGFYYWETDTNGGTLFQSDGSTWNQRTTGLTKVVPTGSTGATAAGRYVGTVAAGAPASGTWVLGDWSTDQAGKRYTCTVGGTPGTWVQEPGTIVITGTANQVVASASTGAITLSTPQSIATSSSVTFGSVAIGGLTGATAASRLAGATASGAPASGAHLLGDVVVDQTGPLWVCTVAGTPGTWVQVGGSAGAVSLLGSSVVAGSVAATIVVSSLPGTANHLKIVALARLDTGSAGSVTWGFRFNADAGANYDWSVSNPTSAAFDGTEALADSKAGLHYITGSGDTAGDVSIVELQVPLYAGTTFRKVYSGTGSFIYTPSSSGMRFLYAAGVWRSTAAITSVTLVPSSGNFIIGSALYVYGLT